MTTRHPERSRRAYLNSHPEEIIILESMCSCIPTFLHTCIPVYLHTCHSTFLNSIRTIRVICGLTKDSFGSAMDKNGTVLDNFGTIPDDFRHTKNSKNRIFSTKNPETPKKQKNSPSIFSSLKSQASSLFFPNSLRCGRFYAIKPFYRMLTH